jgi:hypothetical protein
VGDGAIRTRTCADMVRPLALTGAAGQLSDPPARPAGLQLASARRTEIDVRSRIDPRRVGGYPFCMKGLFSFFSIALLTLSSHDARATIMVKMDLPQLCGRSDVIFVGRAEKGRSHWTPDRRHIVTDTTFVVEEGIKGGGPKTITIRHLGGSVGGIGMRVSGMPVFHEGDRVLLFTELRRGHRYVVGMKQGIFRVEKNAAGQRVVHANLDGLTLAERSPQGRLRMLGPQEVASGPRLLGDFIKHIRQTISLCAKETKRCHVD